jgi:protein-tyrosine kinase
MTNVFEALQRARKEREATAPVAPARRKEPDLADGVFNVHDFVPPPKLPDAENVEAEFEPLEPDHSLKYHLSEMVAVLGAIRPTLDSHPAPILHVVSTTNGEGASSLAREFAYTAATEGNRRTLLIDGNVDNRETGRFFGCPRDYGLLDCVDEQLNVDHVLRLVAGTRLAAACLTGEADMGSFDPARLRALYDMARNRFEMTVIDCPPITSNRYAGLVPSAVDGIILVIEASKLRPAVVLHAKEQVLQAGGKIIGSILNRRQNYIPDFIYKRL